MARKLTCGKYRQSKTRSVKGFLPYSFVVEQRSNPGAGRKKYWFIAGAVVVTVALLLLVVAKSLNPWAEKKLKEEVFKQSKGLYTLQLAAVNVSLLAGTASLDSLVLTPHPSVWKQLEENSPAAAPASISNLKAKQVQVKGISFVKMLFGGRTGLRTVEVNSPDWTLTQMKKDTTTQPLHETVGEKLKGFEIKEIKVTDGSFRLKDQPDSKRAAVALAGVELRVQGLKLDSAAFQAKDHTYYSRFISFSSQKTTFFLPDGNYKIQTGPLAASTKNQSFSIQNLRLVPLVSAGAMARKAGEAVTRFTVQVPEVQMQKVDFATFSKNANVHMASLAIQKPQIKAYKDSKNFKPKTEGLLPHDFIRQLPFGLNIRKVKVTNLYVRYDELSEKSSDTGYATGSNINLTLTNLTNDKNLISGKNPAVLTGSGLLMGKALMKATVRLPLLDPSGYHHIKGSIGKGDPAILNPMVVPSMLVRVKSGFVQNGSFEVELTKTSAKGTLQLQYNNFKIDLLSQGKKKEQSFGKKIKTAVANKLVLKSDSESDGKAPRQGGIAVRRRPERSFLTYWKDCLANGVLSVVGAPM